jgi:hypothetical protein
MMQKHMQWLTAALVALGVGGMLAGTIACDPPRVAEARPRTFTYPPMRSSWSTDESSRLLSGDPHGANMAATPPTIDFAAMDIDPGRYGPDYGSWGNAVLGPDGRYYFGLGDHDANDHAGHDGALLVSYDPTRRKGTVLLYSKDLFGPTGEGKFHGRPDIDPRNGDMYLVGFYHGHVVRYNIRSHQAVDLGQPVAGSGWAEHTWDWQRARLFGVGDGKGGVLVYDTATRTVLHSGLPVDSVTGAPFRWNDRARLLDRTTGNLYGTDADNHLTVYQAARGTFTVLHSTLPSPLRAWTDGRDGVGAFWIFDTVGDVYRFYPDQDRVEYMGKNWGTSGWYVTSLASTADGHYLYYSLSADRSSPILQGQPVLQYDTRTHRVKVIAFLAGYYSMAHGYQTTKVYSVALSRDGSSLFAVANGNPVGGARMPAMFCIHIATSERQPPTGQ